MVDSRRQTADSRQQTTDNRWQIMGFFRLISAVCRLPSAVSLASILLLFATLLLYDSSIPAQSEKRSTSQHSGKVVIESAIKRFQTIETISSKVRLKCHFFSEGYIGHGYYNEKRLPMVEIPAVSPNLFSLVLSFQADSLSGPKSSSSTLRIAANGSEFWKFTDMEGERRLEKVDLVKLQEILARSQKDGGNFSQVQTTGPGELFSLGGLEGTLIQMTKYYDFDSAVVENSSLGSENLAVWKVSAKLKPDRLKAMIASYGGDKAVATHGGEHIPTAVSLYFGKEDLFPYRICYYGGVKENPFSDTENIDLEYRDVAINGSDIATSIFRYDGVENVLSYEATEDYALRILEGN